MALEMSTQEMLLQLLFSAAQDGWNDVAAPACNWLQQQASRLPSSAAATAIGAARGSSSAFANATESLTLRLIEGLPGALRSGDAPGRQHAYQLASALQAWRIAAWLDGCWDHWSWSLVFGLACCIVHTLARYHADRGFSFVSCCRSARHPGLLRKSSTTRSASSSCFAASQRHLPLMRQWQACCCTQQRLLMALPPRTLPPHIPTQLLQAARAQRQPSAQRAALQCNGSRCSSSGLPCIRQKAALRALLCCCHACPWGWS